MYENRFALGKYRARSSSIMLLFYAMSELRSCSLEKKTSLKYLLLASQIGITGDRMTREKEKKIRI